jgi:hypothetical protein
MSRRLYAQTAVAIRSKLTDSETTPEARGAVAEIARFLADAFRADNALFSYQRFFTAAGLDNWGELTPNPVSANGSGSDHA